MDTEGKDEVCEIAKRLPICFLMGQADVCVYAMLKTLRMSEDKSEKDLAAEQDPTPNENRRQDREKCGGFTPHHS